MATGVLIPEAKARQIILSDVSSLNTEEVTLADAHGRIIASDMAAKRTQPPFPASLMDGYAVRNEDIENTPCNLPVIGESRAGVPFGGKCEPGTAVRIFTGAAIPDGADSIVIQENTKPGKDDTVEIKLPVQKGRYIRPIGLDFNMGDILLKRGERLTPQRLALAASMNFATVPVFEVPKVAVISTGDELVMPGQALADGQIIASNAFAITASLASMGCRVLDLGIIPDKLELLETTIKRALEAGCDLIVTLGGASVGDHDLVLPAATNAGFGFQITKVAMRPGKPFLFGRQGNGDKPCFFAGLAGNPVSSIIGFNVFVKPLLDMLAGSDVDEAGFETAKLGCDLAENDERAEYMRATLQHTEDGTLIATPFSVQDSSMLSKLVAADCLLYRPVAAPAACAGDECSIVRLVK